MKNLIVYKVDYANRHDDYNTTTGRFVRTKRIVMTPEEVNQTDGYCQNHSRVEKKFDKQMNGSENASWSDCKYRILRVRKA